MLVVTNKKSRFSTKKESKMGITEDMLDMLEQVAPDELDEIISLYESELNAEEEENNLELEEIINRGYEKTLKRRMSEK